MIISHTKSIKLISPKPLIYPILNTDKQAYKNIIGFSHGREGLHYVIKKIIPKDQPRVLTPSLFCYSALENSGAGGVIISFYDIKRNGDVDADKLMLILDPEKYDVLILNHLFGQIPEDRKKIYEACRFLGILMIDDMCHCASSIFEKNNCLNHEGNYDVKIMSFRKFLPVLTGAAVILNSRFKIKIQYKKISISDSSHLILSHLKLLTQRLVFKINHKGFLSLIRRIRRKTVLPQPYSPKSRLDIKPPHLVKEYIQKIINNESYIHKIGQIRRKNFQILSDVIQPLRPLGVKDIPQVFPVLDKNKTLFNYLEKHGIYCFDWPALELPHDVRTKPDIFPNACELADLITCIPIHQDISEEQIYYVRDLLLENKGFNL
jgi:dTDP-4-amino-4,6-dideoxygalactose transaminase